MTTRHLLRILVLMVCAGGFLAWLFRHSEATLNTGLASIKEARQIEQGSWSKAFSESFDHPLHPVAVMMSHRFFFAGKSPVSWQRAALLVATVSTLLWLIPLYLLGLELGGGRTAWLVCLFAIANPTVGFVVVNALSESFFLLWWTWGLWGAIRFLRDGEVHWLMVSVGFGTLAYWTRPEGLLLAAALSVALVLLPLRRTTRINWPRWTWALAFLLVGSSLLVGPYVMLKGSLGTRPAIARVLGLAPPAHPFGVERQQPLEPALSTIEVHARSVGEVVRTLFAAIGLVTAGFAVFGALVCGPWRSQPRIWLFLTLIGALSVLFLVRLHATGGYCTERHALIPAILAFILASFGWDWVMSHVSIHASWFRAGRAGVYRPGPIPWLIMIGVLLLPSAVQGRGPVRPGPFWIYRVGADYLKSLASRDDKVLDLTDWSIFFSQHPGYTIEDLFDDPDALKTRWIVTTSPSPYERSSARDIIQDLIGDELPAVAIPTDPKPGQFQLRIHDRFSSPGFDRFATSQNATTSDSD